MGTAVCHGRIRYWALIASLALHTTVLAVFTGVRFSSVFQPSAPSRPGLTMRAIERAAAMPKPVPRVVPIVHPAPAMAEPQVTQPPLISKLQEPQVAEPTQPPPVEQEIVTGAETAAVPAPGAAEVEFFGQKSVVQQIAYVVDCSGSMYGQMHQVKEQLKRSILNLNSEQAFCILFFMDGRQILTSGGGQLQLATIESKAEALQFISHVRPKGATDAMYALESALRLKGPDGRGPEVIYFLTDGFDLEGAASQDFASRIETVRQTFLPGSVMHTIGFSPEAQDRGMLLAMAQNTGGGYVEVN